MYVKLKKGLFCVVASNVPQNVTSEGYKHKNFLLAPLAESFYIPIFKKAPPPMIAVVS